MSLTTEGDWADHINWLLKSSECIKRAAILGYPDASMWACSEDFKPIGEELQHLVHQFSDSKAPRIAHLEGVPFLARVKPTYVSGHKASTWFHAFKRNKVIVVAVTVNEDPEELELPGLAAARELADHLEEQGL